MILSLPSLSGGAIIILPKCRGRRDISVYSPPCGWRIHGAPFWALPQNIVKAICAAMPSFSDLLLGLFGLLDSLTGHLILVSYLLAVTDEQALRQRLKRLPPLLLSPSIALLLTLWLAYAVPAYKLRRYFLVSLAIFAMCTMWVMWAWQWDFWRSFSAVCMAAILQVATAAFAQIPFWLFPPGLALDLAVIVTSLLFAGLRRTAALLFSLEIAMETFLILQNGVEGQYMAAYFLLLAVVVLVIVGLIVYLGHRLEDSRTLQIQRDIIAQQQLYEQSLEDIRQEVRSFRHDYKNLLAGLSQQAREGELDALRSSLLELDADFDRHLGEKIQLSTQIGNLRVPQIRSLLLSKLNDMRQKGAACRLEVLYPVEAVQIGVWDFVRCLGILIDNAIEAALETEQPWVEIVLLAQGGRVFLRVSNPYANTIEPGNMWKDGWSTKGEGRGVGLSSYQRILGNYPNTSACTSWENGVFVQELTVEGRA